MSHLLRSLQIFTLIAYLQASELKKTFSGTSACNQTIVLGSDIFSGIIEFFYEHRRRQAFSIFTCNIKIETLPDSFIAIKFLSSPYSLYTVGQTECTTQLAIKSNELNIEKCNFLPQTELSSRKFVDISYKIRRLKRAYYSEVRFKMIFFTYSLVNSVGKCRSNETACVGSKRCVYGPLKCSATHDFCNNSLKYCPNNTDNEVVSIRPVPLTGVYFFLSLSVVLLGVSVYMCFCRGLHLCECSCLCCSTVERTGSEVQNESRQTGNENGADDQDFTIRTVSEVSDDEIEDDDSSVNSVSFDLPPSYSYVERYGINSSVQDVNDAANTSVNSSIENNPNTIQRNSTELPPSYSTVLGHEEEFNVHVY